MSAGNMRLIPLMLLLSLCVRFSTNDSISPSLDEVVSRFKYAVRTLIIPDLSNWDCRSCSSLDAVNEQHGSESTVLHNSNDIDTKLATDKYHGKDKNQSRNVQTPGHVISDDPQHSLIKPVENLLCIDDSLICLTCTLTWLSGNMGYISDSFNKVASVVKDIQSSVMNACDNLAATINSVISSIINGIFLNDQKSRHGDVTDNHNIPIYLRQEPVESHTLEQPESHSEYQSNVPRKRWFHPSDWTMSSLFWKNEMHGPQMMVASWVNQRRTQDNEYAMPTESKRVIHHKALDNLLSIIQSIWSFIHDGTVSIYSAVLSFFTTLATVLDEIYELSGTIFPDWETQASLYNIMLEWTNLRFVWLREMAGRIWKTALESWQSFLLFKDEILSIVMVWAWFFDCLNHAKHQDHIRSIDAIDIGLHCVNDPILEEHADNLYTIHARCCRKSLSLNDIGEHSACDDDKRLLSDDKERLFSDAGYNLIFAFDPKDDGRPARYRI